MLLPFLEIASKLIDKLLPDPEKATEAKLKLVELQQKGDLAELDAGLRAALAQAETNTEEAKSPNLFVSGWRPFVGWTCGAGFAYQFLAQPLLSWASINFSWLPPPAVDVSTLVGMLGGMLGLGAMRMNEKIRGVAA